MTKYRIFAFLLVIVLLLTGCKTSGTPKKLGKNNVLAAWTGDYVDDKLRSAIKEYKDNYMPVVSDETDDTFQISFKTGFSVAKITVALLTPVDDEVEDAEIKVDGFVQEDIETRADGKRIILDIGWWHKLDGATRFFPTWAYLICAEDADGLAHYYYFRVNYVSQKQPDEKYLASDSLGPAIICNGAIYAPDEKLSQTAGEENVGEFVGCVTVSYDNKTWTEISAFRYLPDDGQTNRIIFFDESYRVCTFEIYTHDGTDVWPVNLLENAAYVEIVGADHPVKGPGKKVTIADTQRVGEIVAFLSGLGEKHNRTEINQRHYELFKDHFEEGAIWINENGGLSASDIDVSGRLTDMINRSATEITVVMKDNTKLLYVYKPSSALVRCFNFAYYLTDAQTEQILRIVAWE